MFDSRQLRRWGLSESRLPPGSVVLFREPSVWDVYKWYIVAAVSLSVIQTLLIAGLLLERRQRKQAQRRLDERLQFVPLVAEPSGGFMKIRADEVDHQIGHGLRRIVEELGVDRASLGEFTTADSLIRITHSWTTEGTAPIPRVFEAGEFPWIAGRLLAGHVVCFSRLEELPTEAVTDRLTLLAFGAKSLALVPFSIGPAVCRALSCGKLREEPPSSGVITSRPRPRAQALTIVLMRRPLETSREQNEN